jgi:hypothetical protein
MALSVTTVDFNGAGAKSAIALLSRAIQSGLRGVPEDGLGEAFQGCDWYAVVELAIKNRVVQPFKQALDMNGVAVPATFQPWLDHYRAEAFRMNARNLMTTAMAASALQAAGIDFIVFKGPAQQQKLYGNPFVKPSGDVDLLVSRTQYDAAFALFQDSHALDPNSAAPWWSFFLGEQTLRSRDDQFTTIDLHYRLQRPGCPSPKDIGGFLSRRGIATAGAARVPSPSAQDACLIICLNVVKGLINREPSGAHVVDIIAALGMLSDQETAQFLKLARQEGLSATVSLSLQIARATFGFHDARLGPVPKVLPATDADLAAMTLAPDDEATVWTRRRTILWVLCERRLTVFAREVAWALSGELCRRYTQPGLSTHAVTVAW